MTGDPVVAVTVSPRPRAWELYAVNGKNLAIVQGVPSKALAERLLKEGLRRGVEAIELVAEDPKAAYRQALLYVRGRFAHFTGRALAEHKGAVRGRGIICAGNGLSTEHVLKEACSVRERDPIMRALAAVEAAEEAGGNLYPVRSVALFYLGKASFTLKLEAKDPVKALRSALFSARPFISL